MSSVIVSLLYKVPRKLLTVPSVGGLLTDGLEDERDAGFLHSGGLVGNADLAVQRDGDAGASRPVGEGQPRSLAAQADRSAAGQ
ncbi:hypothetical protein [Streptomyces asiaticus]|uniref:hypothetical protein n=1 Tax=Streptomyces asiaticus TaxID=114695 RepID=UPI003F67809A